MLIRPYQKSDFPVLVRMMEEFQDYLITLDPLKRLRRMPNYGNVYTRNSLKTVQKGKGVYILAEESCAILGFIAGIVEEQSKSDLLETVPSKVGRILELYVDPSSRSHGVGTKLLDAMEKYFRARKCTVVCLEVFAPNTGAQLFYQKNGFVPRNIDMIKVL